MIQHIIILVILNHCTATTTSKWIEPDAWGAKVKVSKTDDVIVDGSVSSCPTDCKCPAIGECNSDIDNQLSTMFYKKLLKLLFNKNNFNEEIDGSYTRNLQLSLSADQMKMLEKSNDPRDWDAIVSSVFQKAEKFSKFYEFLPAKAGIISTTYTRLKELISSSEFIFFLFILGFIYMIYLIHKRFNYGIVMVFLFLVFFSGFLYNYYECNKDLEIESLAALYEVEANDPCSNIEPQNESWTSWIFSRKKSTKQQCIEHLRKKHKTKPQFCRVDKVFFDYIHDIIFMQFQRTIEKCSLLFQHNFETMSFPLFLVSTVIFGLLLPLFIKMIFQHLIDPRVWRQNTTHNNIPPIPPPSQLRSHQSIAENEILLNKLLLEKLENRQEHTEKKMLHLERSISGVQILDTDATNSQTNTNCKKLETELDSSASSQIVNQKPEKNVLTIELVVNQSNNSKQDDNFKSKKEN